MSHSAIAPAPSISHAPPIFPTIPTGLTEARIQRLVGHELVIAEQMDGLYVALRHDGIWGRGSETIRRQPLHYLRTLGRGVLRPPPKITVFGRWCGVPGTRYYNRLPTIPFFVEAILDESENQPVYLGFADRQAWAEKTGAHTLPTIALFRGDNPATIVASIQANSGQTTSRYDTLLSRTGIVVLPGNPSRFLTDVSVRIPFRI